jgi:NAD+ kinase
MILNSKNNQTLNLEKINVICNLEHKNADKIAQNIVEILENKGIACQREDIQAACTQQARTYNQDATFVIVIGGDGTLLSTARFYAKFDIPVFGINSGRLGFLAQLNPEDIEAGIKKLLNGEFKIEQRIMLKAYDSDKKISFDALNDIVVKGGTLSRTARLYLYINNKHVCDYLADGLIVSTPTGSTAYTLSAGGPVLSPLLDAFVIVPICAHSLTVRPLVVPSSETIEIRTCAECELTYLTADGQENYRLETNDRIIIEKNEKNAKLVLLEKENNGFYSVLREKLHWGVSPKG